MRRKAFAYMFLGSVSLIGDAVFLYFAVFSALRVVHGGIYSGLLFAMDPLVRIAVLPWTAIWVDQLSSKIKWYWSVILSLLSFGLALLPGFFPPVGEYGYVWICFLVGLISIASRIGEQLRFGMSFRLADAGIISFSKQTSLSNLSLRGSHAIAPIIASIILSSGWMIAACMNAATFLCIFMASLIGYFSFEDDYEARSPLQQTEISLQTNRLSWWTSLTLLSTNVCVGGLTLVLSSLMVFQSNLLFQYLTPVTALYAGFVLVMLLFLLYPRQQTFADKSTTNIFLLFLMSACFLFSLASIPNTIITLLFLFLGGMAYGSSLVTLLPTILNHFRGKKMVSYTSRIQAFGRVGAVISTLGFGFLIDQHLEPYLLLRLGSIAGLVTLFFLYLLKKKMKILI